MLWLLVFTARKLLEQSLGKELCGLAWLVGIFLVEFTRWKDTPWMWTTPFWVWALDRTKNSKSTELWQAYMHSFSALDSGRHLLVQSPATWGPCYNGLQAQLVSWKNPSSLQLLLSWFCVCLFVIATGMLRNSNDLCSDCALGDFHQLHTESSFIPIHLWSLLGLLDHTLTCCRWRFFPGHHRVWCRLSTEHKEVEQAVSLLPGRRHKTQLFVF